MIIDSPIISGSYAASGSLNQFGNVVISGSLTVTGSIFGTASFATTASYLSGYVSPFPFTGSAIISGSLTVTGSANIPNITGSLLGTSSFALTSSYSLSGGGFPYSGSAEITGSLVITNLSGSGVRYLVADSEGNITAQSASAALKSTQAFTATAGQTTFSVTNGYSTGYVDVFINGSKLNSTEFTDTSGTNIVLATGSFVDDIVEVVKYVPAAGITNNVLRQLTTFTATAGQTVFSASYTPGLIDIFYNGARLSTSDYTANNGTFFTLATASVANDVLDVLVYSYQVGAFSGIGGTGSAAQVAYFSTGNAITGSPNFTISGSTMTVTGSLLVSGSGTFTNIGPAILSGTTTLSGSAVLTGSLNVSGAIVTNSTITAQTLVVQTITSSISSITGSTNFGSLSSNTHTFTGSLLITGSILQLGTVSSNGIGTVNPVSMSLGSTFGTNTVGTNFKLKLYDDTVPNPFGFGVSNALLEIIAGPGGSTAFFTSGSNERMRITSAGNVGIGTTSPSTLLQINTSARTSGANVDILTLSDTVTGVQTSGYGVRILATSNNGQAKSAIAFEADGGTNNDTAISFYTQTSAASLDRRMIINKNGNVGIGTASPGAILEIKSSSATNAMRFTTSNNAPTYNVISLNATNAEGQYIGFAGGGGVDRALYYQSGNGGNHIFRTGDGTSYSERMRITSDGAVLINNTAALSGRISVASLQVTNEIYSRGASSGLFWEDRVNSTYWYGWYATGNTVIYLYNGASGNIAQIAPSTGVYTAISDADKKKDFEQSTIGLNAVMNLKPTLYRMKTEDNTVEKQLGFIAQEVKDYIPQAYVETGEGDEKFIGLSDRPIIAALTKAIQEQQSTITSLQTRIEQLENK